MQVLKSKDVAIDDLTGKLAATEQERVEILTEHALYPSTIEGLENGLKALEAKLAGLKPPRNDPGHTEGMKDFVGTS